MNTPRTKKPKRWSEPVLKPTSRYTSRRQGIEDQDVAAALGFLVSYWTFVEEQMMRLFEELITGSESRHYTKNRGPRLIYSSIFSPKTRIDIMRALLEEAPQNRDKPETFDLILDKFRKLNAKRNEYVHGRWWTSEGDTLLAKPSADSTDYRIPKVVTVKEIERVIILMRELVHSIGHRHDSPDDDT